jgi:hypothetical protein
LVWRLEVPNREFQFANAICPTSGCFKYGKSFLVKKFRLKYAKGPALKGRLSFSPCISKNFQIFPALSVNFKKGPWVDFFYDVASFCTCGTND